MKHSLEEKRDFAIFVGYLGTLLPPYFIMSPLLSPFYSTSLLLSSFFPNSRFSTFSFSHPPFCSPHPPFCSILPPFCSSLPPSPSALIFFPPAFLFSLPAPSPHFFLRKILVTCSSILRVLDNSVGGRRGVVFQDRTWDVVHHFSFIASLHLDGHILQDLIVQCVCAIELK